MDTRLERDRYVTAHYEDLQGLLWVPFGALLVVAGILASTGVAPGTGSRLAGDLLALGGGALVLGAILARALIQRHYRRRYGQVLEIESAFSRRYKTYLAVTLPLLVAVLALETAVPGGPSSLLGFVFAAGAGEVASWWPERHFRGHWLIGAALLASCGALGFAYELASGSVLGAGYYGPLLALAGTYLLVCGVLDHRLLAGTVREPPETEVTEGG